MNGELKWYIKLTDLETGHECSWRAKDNEEARLAINITELTAIIWRTRYPDCVMLPFTLEVSTDPHDWPLDDRWHAIEWKQNTSNRMQWFCSHCGRFCHEETCSSCSRQKPRKPTKPMHPNR